VKAGGLGCILEAVVPGDVVFIEKISKIVPLALKPPVGGKMSLVMEMAEGGGRHEAGAVGEGESEDCDVGSERATADRAGFSCRVSS
jgi:hypothetical protein